MGELQTKNIQNFLRTAYSDEGLAALLAHAEDGKLSYTSCTCLIGSVNPGHALLPAGGYCEDIWHLYIVRALPFAKEAEAEFDKLGDPGDGLTPWSDELRRERVLPLIQAEISRRGNERIQFSANILARVEVVNV